MKALRYLVFCALGCAPVLSFANGTIGVFPSVINGLTTGGPTTPPSFTLRFTQQNPPNSIVAFQADLCIPGPVPGDPVASVTPVAATIPNHLTSCVIVSGNTATCPAPNVVIRVIVLNQALTALASPLDVCTITMTISNPATPGTYPLDVYDELASDASANPVLPFTPLDGQLVITALQGPTIAFTPDGNPAGPGFPITMTPSVPGFATTTITATSATPGGNPGDPGGPNGQIVNCSISGTHASFFSFNPAVSFPITYTAGTPFTQSLTVQCERGPNPRNAQLECRVNDQGGARSEWYDLTCPGALPADLNLPPSGPITLPGGFVGNTVSQPLPVTVVTPGETGGGNATVNCTATPPISVTPASIIVPPNQNTANPPAFTVSCQLTDQPQSGAVNCTIIDRDGQTPFSYEVTCPAGSLVPPPRPVPAGSAWSWYVLGLFTLLLGGFVAYRRLS